MTEDKPSLLQESSPEQSEAPMKRLRALLQRSEQALKATSLQEERPWPLAIPHLAQGPSAEQMRAYEVQLRNIQLKTMQLKEQLQEHHPEAQEQDQDQDQAADPKLLALLARVQAMPSPLAAPQDRASVSTITPEVQQAQTWQTIEPQRAQLRQELEHMKARNQEVEAQYQDLIEIAEQALEHMKARNQELRDSLDAQPRHDVEVAQDKTMDQASSSHQAQLQDLYEQALEYMKDMKARNQEVEAPRQDLSARLDSPRMALVPKHPEPPLAHVFKLIFWCGLLAFNFYALLMLLWAWVALLVHLASGLPWTAPLSHLALGIATTLALSFGLKVTSGYVLDLLGSNSASKALKQLAP